jgi:hypothetical protein
VLTVAAVGRRHIEDYKPWLALRPGPKVPRLTPNTIAHPPWPASSPKPNLPLIVSALRGARDRRLFRPRDCSDLTN